ncbi:hypothetical protein [Azospirillum rugosum]|uniref:Uncharacterized protein n=1 Tax=Azospirillum rugosum TaxID=416170 RepID=A0ABS4SR99_9PROT|nr:hypothetical protein [Azospirillum rugosum]MBP2295098.1 hypothetical protein [Azospirillum rugosum]MDQ0528472.1 hypothetical protein [Azospirillum rugosum]
MTKSVTKVYVFPVPGREADVEELKRLIRAGGCSIVCANESIDAFEQCVGEADVVVILICPESANDKVAEQVAELANKLGKRVVGVWASDVQAGKLPLSLHRHGDATVRLNAVELAVSVCQGGTAWVTPDGNPRPKPKTPRHNKR